MSEATKRQFLVLDSSSHCISFEAFLHNLEDRGSWEGELEHTTRDGQSVIVESRMVLNREAEHTSVVWTF